MKTLIISIFITGLLKTCFAQPVPTDSLFLGQSPPADKIRKIFNLIPETGYTAVEKVAISPNGDEIYYEETDANWTSFKLKYYKYFNNKWNGPFNLFDNYYCISISPDGKYLYFENNNYKDCWRSERSETGWNAPLRFIKKYNIHSLNATSSGHYYLSSKPFGGLGQLDISRIIVNDLDTTLVGLGFPLNSIANDGDFFISKDESFIIFMSNRDGGKGSTDLYISFRTSNDAWTNPINLGESINTTSDDFGPYVTSDNKYMFYESGYNGPSSIYWLRFDNLLDSLKRVSGIVHNINRSVE